MTRKELDNLREFLKLALAEYQAGRKQSAEIARHTCKNIAEDLGLILVWGVGKIPRIIDKQGVNIALKILQGDFTVDPDPEKDEDEDAFINYSCEVYKQELKAFLKSNPGVSPYIVRVAVLRSLHDYTLNAVSRSMGIDAMAELGMVKP